MVAERRALPRPTPTIAPMLTLRRIRLLTCLVLAWFALSVGVAIASPWVQPQALQWICSGAGEVQLIVSTDDGTPELRGPALDCSLCLPLGTAPPPPALAQVGAPTPPTLAPLPAPLEPLAVRTAAPLPARGPPRL